MMDNNLRKLAGPELEEAPGSKTELLLKFGEEDTLLFVAVKLPGEIPRVLPMGIEVDLTTFIEEFDSTWRDVGEKVLNEFIRGATGRDA